MYWILLSIGAINSFIPIAIILVFIAAAAGATRGYSLLSLFGISTLIGAGSGGKKGSMAGKSGYSSFMRSACSSAICEYWNTVLLVSLR